MSIAATLAHFNSAVAQCDQLIVDAHRYDNAGQPLFILTSREYITKSAFLNLFIAWEEFIEQSLKFYMTGAPSVSGTSPQLYVSPLNLEHADRFLIHTMRFFDYSNHANITKIAKIYFKDGEPYATAISSISFALDEIKIIRNSCAHISSTTQSSLLRVIQQILGSPHPGMSVYDLLITNDPRNIGSTGTVYKYYRDNLSAAATIIANN